jgi:UDP-N-acetylmuramoyl-L-alanyl-D-glutamate--2,6-diaminopimelate ligase
VSSEDPTAPVPTRPDTSPRVALRDVAELLGTPAPDAAETTVTGVSQSTGSVRPGDLFAALPGARVHGAQFVPEVARAGAVAILTDPDGAAMMGEPPVVPVLVVDRPRQVLGAVAAFVHGEPGRALRLVGVTGTQGKTTMTQLLYGALRAAGHRAAVIGTMGTWVDGAPVESDLTTPEAPDLHALFAVMRERSVGWCVMEVSSHAIVQGRVDGAVFDVSVFMNFGRDHLDFHGTEENYFAAKAALFCPRRSRRGVLNVDDDRVRNLLDHPAIPMSTYGIDRPADWTATDVSTSANGSTFVLRPPRGRPVRAEVRVPGRFNVSNALAAVTAGAEAGASVAELAAGIGTVEGVAGRMQVVDAGQPFAVVVDYAHKPDAIHAVLEALRAGTHGRLWIVLGAGGDRDRGKRPLMGEVAGRLADVVVVTDDNPRSEDPAEIRRELLTGVSRGVPGRVHEEGDRAAAIAWALSGAGAGDTVLIAGKGHETGQEVGGTTHPFDDRTAAEAWLAANAARWT